MSEFSLVEKPMLEWLCGNFDDPADSGLGWTYRSAEQMESYGRTATDPIVEALLLPAIERINAAVTNAGQAKAALEIFRRILALPDPLERNRRALEALREGIPIVLTAGQDAVTVKLIELDPARVALNDFTASNQYSVRGEKTARADTILLVNGIPLVIAEYKSFITSGHDWTHGVRQVHRYQRQAPQLLATNLFCVAADENEFLYGTVDVNAQSESDITAQREHWSHWLSQYPQRRGYWNLNASEKDPDAVRAATMGLLQPLNVLDFLAHFCVFESHNGRTTKILARYQQFEAANDIVDRVLEGEFPSGLIWHTQGSGKSLTMIFAAYKLRRQPALQNPTVLVVVDRTDLKTQISTEFEKVDYPGVSKALGVRDLKAKIRQGARETIITTIQCFQGMNDLPPNERTNIIILLDEAHRSQKGQGESFSMTMRAKLPNAARFGMTGTPIDRTLTNTFRTFGPVVDGQQERYLSYYGIRQSIEDGATLEVYYQQRTVPIEVDEEPLNTTFEQMCDDLEVEDADERTLVQRREARWKALVCDPRRIEKVVAHLAEHFLQHPDPNGFKAQLVTVDRNACVLYKDALDAEFARRGLPQAANWSEVVISSSQNDGPELERFHYDKAATDHLIDRFKLTREEWESGQRKVHGEARAKWQAPLKILIVCDKLLTGFDAPVEQVMYLDKPLRDHNLLQAIARTNRPLPALNKRNGLVIDYFGVFLDLQKALNFDEKVREEAVIDWDKLREQFPGELGRALGFFHGIEIKDTRECYLACLRRLNDPRTAREFEAQWKRLQTLWEALSPDDCLYPYRHQYAWLGGMYIAHRRRNGRAATTHHELTAKTRDLIRAHTDILDIAEEVPIYKIDKDYLVKAMKLPTPADRAAELEAALTAELSEGNSFLYKKLGERLKNAVERKEAGDEAARKLLDELTGIVDEVTQSKEEPERLQLTAPGEYDLFTVVREYASDKDETRCADAARFFLQQLRERNALPSGWSASVGGSKAVRLNLHTLAWHPDVESLNLCPVEDDDPPFLSAAVEELAKSIA